MRWLPLAILVPLAGCQGGPLLHVDPAFTADERREIVAAAELWRHASSGALDITLIPGLTGKPAILRYPLALRDWDKCNERPEDKGCLAVTVHADETIYVDADSIYDPRGIWFWEFETSDYQGIAVLGTVFAHELGHWLGNPREAHRHAPPSIMTAYIGAQKCVTRADLDIPCRLYRCTNLLQPCNEER